MSLNLSKSENSPVQLDEIDRKLLALLSKNSRRTNNSLAQELGIAASTCLARLNALRDSGVISRFTIEVDPQVLGRELEALIFVKIRPGARHLMSNFASEMRSKSGVRQLFFLGGADDFVLHVAVRNSAEVRQFVLDNLSANPAVATTQTSLVFEHGQGSGEF